MTMILCQFIGSMNLKGDNVEKIDYSFIRNPVIGWL